MILALLGTITVQTSYPSSYIELNNPTYIEALQFTESDQTDKNLYKDQTYTCANYAADFKTNAGKAGYKCGYVRVLFADSSHALNCFNTTDHGLIFIEPQLDELVTLTRGKPYWDRTRYVPQYGNRIYDDTVSGFLIEW